MWRLFILQRDKDYVCFVTKTKTQRQILKKLAVNFVFLLLHVHENAQTPVCPPLLLTTGHDSGQ